MRRKYIQLIAILITITLSNCQRNAEIPTEVEVQNFVWKGLNAYYLWQQNVPELQDNRFATQEELNNYITNREPNELFEKLLYKRGEIDKWSWIVTDYVALEQSFAGVTKNNGMEFGLKAIGTDIQQIFGFVRYILPNSDAATKEVHRGDIIYGINGQQLTRSNYKSLLFTTESYTVNFGTYTNTSGTAQVVPNGESLTLTKSIVQENPIHTVNTHQVNGHKIGYLFYNQFVSNYDSALNQAILQLKGENITDLVLDLRYNGGGSVQTAVNLASMITGQYTNQLFAKERWNPKWQNFYETEHPDYIVNNFTNRLKNGEAINSLNLNKIVIITTNRTASASELVINGLKPYINVILVGQKTTGKYVGSVTLYDSENYTKKGDNLNPNHTYAMQPLVLEIQNKLGENDKDGFDPDYPLPEDYTNTNTTNLGVMGEITEPLLEQAIAVITGTKNKTTKIVESLPTIADSKAHNPILSNMYVELK